VAQCQPAAPGDHHPARVGRWGGAGVVGTGSSVKAFDTTSAPSASWFQQAYKDGFRLYVLSGNSWGQNTPWPQASGLCKLALDAGLKIAVYTRDPRWYAAGINACKPYVNRLQFFALDIESDPGVAVTRAMVNAVPAMGVRPVIYSGYGMWPQIMGATNTSFADVPLWDTNAGSATSMNPVSYTPNFLTPKPVAYGGWNTSNNLRIGVQQTFETIYNGINIDINSFAADFLTVP
jgi:hypothetical protein